MKLIIIDPVLNEYGKIEVMDEDGYSFCVYPYECRKNAPLNSTNNRSGKT